MAQNGQLYVNEIVDYLKGALNEEMAIEQLAGTDLKYVSTILYLRSLENGICSFPYELADVPTASFVLGQIARSYPDTKLVAEGVFQTVYDQTLTFGANQLRQGKTVTIWRIIEAWRRSTLKSSN
jgi:hypothetical protein